MKIKRICFAIGLKDTGSLETGGVFAEDYREKYLNDFLASVDVIKIIEHQTRLSSDHAVLTIIVTYNEKS